MVRDWRPRTPGDSDSASAAKPQSPFAGVTSKQAGPAGPGQPAVVAPSAIAQRKPLAALAKQAEEEDFAFDLDLNPGVWQ